MNSPGHLIVVAAPSGAGKTSLVLALAAQVEEVVLSISTTTRPPRPADDDGRDYFFVDGARFDQMIAEDIFLEYADVFDYRYGTSKEWVCHKLEQGIDVILEIDWQGARQVKQQFPKAVSVFILPPSLADLQHRLESRNQDSEQVVAARMAAAKQEISHFREFDYLVLNDDFERALQDLKNIISSLHLKTPVQLRNLQELLAELGEND